MNLSELRKVLNQLHTWMTFAGYSTPAEWSNMLDARDDIRECIETGQELTDHERSMLEWIDRRMDEMASEVCEAIRFAGRNAEPEHYEREFLRRHPDA